MTRVITLTTDFGARDHFVAEMKGVILSINPRATIVDITHDVEKFNVVHGAFVLACAYKWFPRGTIHVVVVDPGVGTSRRAILVETERYYFVGPDNGVLAPAAARDGVRAVYDVSGFREWEVSTTFHGRDIFAPVAARLSLGVPPSSLGRRVSEFVMLDIFRASSSNGVVEGRVVHIDSFGNVITSIDMSHVRRAGFSYGDVLDVQVGRARLRLRFLPAYGFAERGEALALVNSEGFFEIAINASSAASALGVKVGDPVVARRA